MIWVPKTKIYKKIPNSFKLPFEYIIYILAFKLKICCIFKFSKLANFHGNFMLWLEKLAHPEFPEGEGMQKIQFLAILAWGNKARSV